MRDLLISLLAGLTASLRSRASLQVEILSLRHQLAVLQRSKPKEVVLRPTDQLLEVQRLSRGIVVEIPRVGGLHHRYERRAA